MLAVIFSAPGYYVFGGKVKFKKADHTIQNSLKEGVNITLAGSDKLFVSNERGHIYIPIKIFDYFVKYKMQDYLCIDLRISTNESIATSVQISNPFSGMMEDLILIDRQDFDGFEPKVTQPACVEKQFASNNPVKRLFGSSAYAQDPINYSYNLVNKYSSSVEGEHPFTLKLEKIDAAHLLEGVKDSLNSADSQYEIAGSIMLEDSNGESILHSLRTGQKIDAVDVTMVGSEITFQEPVYAWAVGTGVVNDSVALWGDSQEESDSQNIEQFYKISYAFADQMIEDNINLYFSPNVSAGAVSKIASFNDDLVIDVRKKLPYEVVVFEKHDTKEVSDTLAAGFNEQGLWYRPVSSVLETSINTNALFIGESVPISASKKALKVIQNNNIELRKIEYNLKLKSGKYYTMQLGASTTAENCEIISSDKINMLLAAVSYSQWDEIIDICS